MADLLQFPLPFSYPSFSPDSGDLDSPQNTLELSDVEARLAALDIRRSWIVEAPAGSGKTGLLIQRFLKLLAFGEVQRPSEILAITFTRKAANELRTRVLEQLAAASRADTLPADAAPYEKATREFALAALARDREGGWRLLEDPQQLNIRTIDSFSGELAGRLPLLSGGAGQREPVEDAGPFYEEAARRTLRELGGGHNPVLSDALRSILLHRDGQIGECVRLIADMLRHREQWGELVPLHTPELDESFLDITVRGRLERTLERAVCRSLSHASGLMDPDLLHELALFAARLSTEPGYSGKVSPIAMCAGLAHAPGTAAADRDHWLALLRLLLTEEGSWRTGVLSNHLGFQLPRSDAQWLKHLLAQIKSEEHRRPALREALCALRTLPPIRYPDDQWRVAKALFHVLRHALAELTVLFSERNLCDFTEPALIARSLLRSDSSPSELLHLPGAQLSHLLVDEMQDTSTGQYQLLELLTQHWDGRTETLFLVGDPKQSIYGFRQACVERFLRTQSAGRLGEIPLGALRLTANFRSQSELVDQFNETFGRILPSPDEIRDPDFNRVEVPFVAATAVRAGGVSPALHWHIRLDTHTPVPDENEDEDLPTPSALADDEHDALHIRRIIEDFIADFTARHASGPLSANGERQAPRIAVLARSRAHLAPVVTEFQRDHGRGPLPFRAVDVEILNERPEVLDLLALTRALLHPGDRVAWLAVLRSPVCGLSLADLLALTGEGPTAEANATVAHLIATRAHRLSHPGQQLLQRAREVLAAAQASVGRTALSTHVERTWRSLGADAPLRPDQLRNAHRFLHLLRELDDSPEPLTIGLLERRLRGLYAEAASEAAVVELMTIHKAKGLEWDLVIVPALERGTGSSRHELLKWLELDSPSQAESEVVLAPISGKGEASSALYNWLGSLQRSREIAEAKRLFYVACTRAREELHLFAACQRKLNGELRTPGYKSLLRAGWAAAEPVVLQQIASAETATTATPPAPGPQLVLPRPPEFTLALAASAEPPPASRQSPPHVQHLPLDFAPLDRFRRELGPALPYPPASTLRHGAPYARPEGSFASRAFGNVVHRFLELAAHRLADGSPAERLLADLPGWQARLLAAFRSEGLPAALCQRDAERALRALDATLRSPAGHWLLSPHPGARSERGLQVRDETNGLARNLRADRVFSAGAEPFSTGPPTHLWIVDFKTAEPGGRSREDFLTAEKAKYLPQMQAYARASLDAAQPGQPVMLALFYPALTQLLYWPFVPFVASQHTES